MVEGLSPVLLSTQDWRAATGDDARGFDSNDAAIAK